MKNELLDRVKTQLKNNWCVDRDDIQALIDIAEQADIYKRRDTVDDELSEESQRPEAPCDGVTWCQHRINDSNVDYIRLDDVLKSLNDEIKKMPDEELLNFVDEIEKWCYLGINDEPHISLNGIIRAIEILEQNRKENL